MLERYLVERRQQKPILLMTHIVMGYPSFEECFEIVEAMVRAGVDLVELQIPFSEPMADGPVILQANQKALDNGSTVDKCLAFAEKVTSRFDIPFLFMTYYNIPFRFGVTKFVERMQSIGIRGAIIPDLPPEEAAVYLSAMSAAELCPIFIYSPNTSVARMQLIAEHARGFLYCVARKGVTGGETHFAHSIGGYLERCRQATQLPLAVGFGVQSKSDVDFLRDKADIAVIGSQTLRIVDQHGVAAVEPFLASLR